jgi:DNA-binding LacI/PurR family transcriptional regulator
LRSQIRRADSQVRTYVVKSVREPAMTDVAKLAGVSHQTVSRVLNDHPNVKEQTRARVRAAITELGYRPNRAARVLVTGTSQVIGVVSRSSTLYGPAATLAALAEAALQHGFTVNVESVRTLDRRPVSDAIGRLLDQRVAGLVVIAPVESANEALDDLPDDIPLVNIDGDPQRPTELVTVDQEAGAYAATTHLLKAGHRTVWHVSGPNDWFDSRGRVAGWQRALTEAGAEIPPLMPADWSAASGYRTGQILARMNDVTAVFAANDHLALGILRALHERGRRVPEDISVVGFDDVPEAAYYIPPLTTIRPDFDAVATASLDLLLAQIRSGHRHGDRRMITPTLVSRDSVAPPRS